MLFLLLIVFNHQQIFLSFDIEAIKTKYSYPSFLPYIIFPKYHIMLSDIVKKTRTKCVIQFFFFFYSDSYHLHKHHTFVHVHRYLSPDVSSYFITMNYASIHIIYPRNINLWYNEEFC